jgi:type IV secretion system protein VirB5
MAAALALGVAALLAPPPAHAQLIVHDPTSFAKLIEEARTALAQLEALKAELSQGERLFNSLNQPSGVNAIASGLLQPGARSFLPDADAFTAAGGDLAKLGALAARAQAIRSSLQLYAPPRGDIEGAALSAAGDRAARDLATAQAVGEAGAKRLEGLQQLQAALGAAGDARAVLDLSARLALEQAMGANDVMRIQGLAMSQAAEDKLALQRERERAAAAASARLSLYRSAFQ